MALVRAAKSGNCVYTPTICLHLGFNSFTYSGGKLGQFAYISRLEFNANPKTGVPLAPRYDLVNVTRLFRPGLDSEVVAPDPKHSGNLLFNENAISIGELRGFTRDGREVIYIGYPWESSNIDLFAADLETGRVRRLTSNPEYTDPVDSSPDDTWIVAMDTRGSDRQMFVAAMRGIPPITDLLTTTAVSSIRNNGQRRFFQPYLIDRYGDRGDYQGQRLNAGNGAPGSASDPNWNGMADPRWSPDGTRVAYWQSLVTSPACGGANPLPCPKSTEPGGRRSRIMIAHLGSRMPLAIPPAKPLPDSVPWGTPYVPGGPMPARASILAGDYVLRGKISGIAQVRITEAAQHSDIAGVAVQYTNYSDDGAHIINGGESVTQTYPDVFTVALDWHSNLVQTGSSQTTKVTSPDGFKLSINMMTNIFQATGTMTTTVGDHVYRQPANGT
jgi:Tol biopolymer transport system component